jgi:transposase
MAVMIGVDPHKGSHTAVALDEHEHLLGEVKVRSSSVQTQRLIEWAGQWPARTWAVEGAGGLGYLLAQQLLAAGERVLDVPPKLAARVRVLSSGKVNKNDPNDARAVAVAALRSPGVKPVAAEDHAGVLRVWAKRNNDLGRLRNKAACRLHSVLCDLVAGGIATEISADAAEQLLKRVAPANAFEAAKVELAAELIADVRHLDEQMAASKRRIAAAVKASGSTLTQLYGVGAVVARHGHRLQRQHRPLRQPGPLRRLHRHRTRRGLLRRPPDPPGLAAGEPPAQPRPPHRRDLPDPPPRHRGPLLLRT